MKVERRKGTVKFHVMCVSGHQRPRPEDSRAASISEAAKNLLVCAKVVAVGDQEIDVANLAGGELTEILLGQMQSL